MVSSVIRPWNVILTYSAIKGPVFIVPRLRAPRPSAALQRVDIRCHYTCGQRRTRYGTDNIKRRSSGSRRVTWLTTCSVSRRCFTETSNVVHCSQAAPAAAAPVRSREKYSSCAVMIASSAAPTGRAEGWLLNGFSPCPKLSAAALLLLRPFRPKHEIHSMGDRPLYNCKKIKKIHALHFVA